MDAAKPFTDALFRRFASGLVASFDNAVHRAAVGAFQDDVLRPDRFWQVRETIDLGQYGHAQSASLSGPKDVVDKSARSDFVGHGYETRIVIEQLPCQNPLVMRAGRCEVRIVSEFSFELRKRLWVSPRSVTMIAGPRHLSRKLPAKFRWD
tara:strand:+ start:88 stop:540 length:453 start_codon:yes stop_codon:yes gene_type:complete